ncbi:asparagine synthase-related protein [Pseudoxanthomonas sp. UTMC 1351]|uniref:asparagine synthase-related protein n=1 Tax=Pseudoxanthomonas sp. UTMC 1351 TaxID=2695853 RepID=UPI0034D01811
MALLSAQLFVTQATPVLSLPGVGTILGNLFFRDGLPVTDADRFPHFTGHAQARKYIVENCWGPYLLFQPDIETGGFTVLRDPSPSGDIPCLYSIRSGTGFITSDIYVPVRLGLYHRRVDWDVVSHRLLYPQLKSARTALSDIRELLPGRVLRLEGTHMATDEAWSPWDFVAPGSRHCDPGEAATDVRNAVSSAVQALVNQDKAVLLELSGGLDSSIVGACTRNSSARVACTTLVTTVPGADERHYAAQIAHQLDVELQTATLHPAEARFDFPLPPQCTMPRVGTLQHAVDEIMLAAGDRHGVDSFFSGGGGDTVFGHLETAAPAADAFRECGAAAGLAAVRDLATLHQCTFWKAGQLTLRKLRLPPAMFRGPDRCLLTRKVADTPPDPHPWHVMPTDALPGDRERIRGLATCQVYRDSLVRGTQRTMRMPLLSQPVVEACLRTPSWMWISGGRNRAVARAAFADLLPPDILNRRSKGTFMGYLGAVYRRNREQMRHYLMSGQLQAHGLIDADALQRLMTNDLPPRGHSFTRMFDLCMVENWIRRQS